MVTTTCSLCIQSSRWRGYYLLLNTYSLCMKAPDGAGTTYYLLVRKCMRNHQHNSHLDDEEVSAALESFKLGETLDLELI